MADYSQILLDVADGVATLTLNRPQKMNAFTGTMMSEIIDAFDRTDADDSVRAVIVTGAGDRAFCAGADLTPDDGKRPFSDPTEVADLSDVRVRDGGGYCTLRIFNSKKPVIGAINGAAVGIGATMQLPMDFRLASTSARFGFVFARRGIVPEAASSWFLPRVVGMSQALEWCMTGRVFGAEEAEGRRARAIAPCAGRPHARRPCTGTRDRRQHERSLCGDDAGDAVAQFRHAAPDARPPGR
jgi:enoyl-CoA hydratase/carnithine racemase